MNKAPYVALRSVEIAQALVGAQVARVLRTTIPANVAWRRNHKPPDRHDKACHKRRILQHGDAQCGVEAFADQIGLGIGEMKVDRHVGISTKKLRQQWRDPTRAKRERRRKLHKTAGLA